MTEEDVKNHSRHLAFLYAMLADDMSGRTHDIDAHNLCSAVVERGSNVVGTYFAYSNPSALNKTTLSSYAFVIGNVKKKLIDRGGMQDLHTEVRLINHLYDGDILTENTVVSFFSSRSVCKTCRKAIMDTMKKLKGTMGLMAYEFKAEDHGTVTEKVYPILEDPDEKQMDITYL